jgi:hypothetical protein
MDPKTVQLILFAEQMASLAAKTIMDLRTVLSNSNTKTVDEILDDADAMYQQIIADAQNPPPSSPPTKG